MSHCLDRLFCARTVPIFSITLTARRTTSGAVHPANAITTDRRRSAGQAGALRFSPAPRGGIASVHGVVAHFLFLSPPAPRRSGAVLSRRGWAYVCGDYPPGQQA